MKIMHIITGLEVGGAETMLLRLLERIDPNRYSSEVVSLTTRGPIGERIAALGIPVHALGMRPNRPGFMAVARMVRLIRRLRPDVVQTWMYHSNLVGGIAARLAGNIPVVWGLHHFSIGRHQNKFSSWVVIRAGAPLSRIVPTTIVCCAEATRTVHGAIGYRADRLEVIPNGFDLNHFRPAPEARRRLRQELGLGADTPLVGIVASFSPIKDHATFVAAMGRVARRFPDAHVVLCGLGLSDDNAGIAAMVERAGIRDRAHLLGRRSDMDVIHAGLDIEVSSSRGEAMPLVIGEAMASGVPCVVTDVGDSARLVGTTGRVVPAGDAEALAGAVCSMLGLVPSALADLGGAARRRITEHFELTSTVQQYESLYSRLAVGDARPAVTKSSP